MDSAHLFKPEIYTHRPYWFISKLDPNQICLVGAVVAILKMANVWICFTTGPEIVFVPNIT